MSFWFTISLINFSLEGWSARELLCSKMVAINMSNTKLNTKGQEIERLNSAILFFPLHRNAHFAASLVLLLGVKLKPA